MGHQLYYSFCKKCGGMYGLTNKKLVFNDCKCMKKPVKQMEEKDFKHMNIILSGSFGLDATEKQYQYEYWQKRVLDRIDYLTPLIKECVDKKFDLMTLSKELAQEWIKLHDAVDFYKFKYKEVKPTATITASL